MGYINLPLTGGGSSVARTFLTGSNVAVTNTGATTTIAGLSPSLEAGKLYRVTWYFTNQSTSDAAAVWRIYPSFPSGITFVAWKPSGTNPADQQNTGTPSNDVLVTQVSEGLQAQDIILSQTGCLIKMGASAGTLTFGVRYVVAGTGTIFADYSWVEVEEIG